MNGRMRKEEEAMGHGKERSNTSRIIHCFILADDASVASTSIGIFGYILFGISWVMVGATLPFSLCVIFKVGVTSLFLFCVILSE